jgi:hypothetical protein
MSMCPHEHEVVRALRDDAWTDEMRTHVAGCEQCAEALMVSEVLCEADRQAEVSVTEPGLVWWKMQLRARREFMARAARPIVWAERGALAVLAVCLVWAVAWLSSVSAGVAAAGVAALVVLSVTAGGAVYLAWHRK